MINLDTKASISWAWTCEYFLETNRGNYIWKCPDYVGGDDTISKFDGSLDDFIKSRNIPYVRDKGIHSIGEYCGQNVKFV